MYIMYVTNTQFHTFSQYVFPMLLQEYSLCFSFVIHSISFFFVVVVFVLVWRLSFLFSICCCCAREIFTVPETECRRWLDEFCIKRKYCGLQLEFEKLVVVVVIVAADVISMKDFIDGLVLVAVVVFWILLMMDCVDTAYAGEMFDDTVTG